MNNKNNAYDKVCERCGQTDLILSQIDIKFNYGSKYDTERISFAVCGECIDKIYEYILSEREGRTL